jgi:anti-sigma B factor antagonist
MTGISIKRYAGDGGVLRMAVAGEVDLCTGEVLSAEVRKVITGGLVRELIIDLGLVTFLDPAGISVLVNGNRLAAERGVAYLVTNPHGVVRKALQLTGVLSTLTERD